MYPINRYLSVELEMVSFFSTTETVRIQYQLQQLDKMIVCLRNISIMLHCIVTTKMLTIVVSFLVCMAVSQQQQSQVADELLHQALTALNAGDYTQSRDILLRAYASNMSHLEVIKTLGVVYVQHLQDFGQGIHYFQQAVELSNYSDEIAIANYVESLRLSGETKNMGIGSDVCARYRDTVPQTRPAFAYNCGNIANIQRDFVSAIDYYTKAINIDVAYIAAWHDLIGMLIEPLQRFDVARANIQTLIDNNLANAAIYALLGDVHLVHDYDLIAAVGAYKMSISLDATYYKAHRSLAAALQMNRQLREADAVYQHMLATSILRSQFLQDDGIMNNYGSLMGLLGRPEQQEYWLLQAVQANPKESTQLVNVATFYEGIGEYEKAAHYFDRALGNRDDDLSCSLRLRRILMMPAVYDSFGQMISTRARIENELELFVHENSNQVHRKQETADESSFDTVHFYIPYFGVNDRKFQQLMTSAYSICLADTDSAYATLGYASVDTVRNRSINSKVRIGFISVYFGLFEPHGLLVEGVIQYLPKQAFKTYLLPLVGSKGSDTHKSESRLLPKLIQYSDEIVYLPLKRSAAARMVAELELDVLVFVDTLAEPMAHFLAMTRLAPIQVCWLSICEYDAPV
jgi:tetratricopeptide (TPR) repeat protein